MNAKSSYLKHYYGKLEGTGTNFAGGMTHDQIAGVMGISRSRVWQIERRALRKLARNPVMRRMLGMANFTPANTTPPP